MATAAKAVSAPDQVAMKVTVNRSDFVRALGHATAIVERKNMIPVLQNVLLEAVGDTLRMTATDLNMQVTLNVTATVDVEGATTVSAGLLLGIVREFPDGAQVELRLEEGRLQVVNGRSRYKLNVLPVDQFPLMPEEGMAGAFELLAEDIVGSLARVSFAQDTDQVVRPQYCGVNVETDGGDLTFVATDGKRIAWATLPAPEGVALESAILPSKLVSTLSKLLDEHEGDVRLAFGERKLSVEFGDTVLKVKMIDGTYPPWRKILPKGESKRLLVKGNDLASAVRRASAVALERTRAVKLELSTDKATISARSQNFDEAVEEAQCVWEGGDYSFGFNSRFLLDTLAACAADELQVDFYSGQTPLALFTNPNDASGRWLLAPMAV